MLAEKNCMGALKALVFLTCIAVLSGCLNGGDDDDDSTTSGTVQFYNASSNSSATRFLVDDSLKSVVSFGDASSRISLEADTYEISIERTNVNDASNYVELISEEVSVVNGSNRLYVMSGEFSEPLLTEYQFDPVDDLESTEATMMGFNLTSDHAQIEIYYSDSEGDQASASLLATLGIGGQSDFVTLDSDDYLFYVVDADTGETLLTTKTVPFTGGYNYFVIVRDDVVNGGISLDQMTSSTFVYNYPNPEANAQVRTYQSIDDLSAVDLTLAGTSETAEVEALTSDTLSDFVTLPYGDYVMKLTDADASGVVHIQNKLLSLQAGAAKNILLYRNSANAVAALVYSQDLRTRVYEHDINLISLSDIRDEDDDRYLLRAYFVNEEKGETKETASQVVTGIEFASVENFTLVTGNYAVYLMYTDDDNQDILVAEKALLSLAANANYQLILEPDATAYNGYRLSVLQ